MKSVKVVFDSAYKEYSYVCPDESVEKGDYYLVLTPNGNPAVVQVVSVSNIIPQTATKAVLQKVNLKSLEEANDAFFKKVEVYKEALQKLEEKVRIHKERDMYRILAEQDKEAAMLLEVVNGFSKGQ